MKKISLFLIVLGIIFCTSIFFTNVSYDNINYIDEYKCNIPDNEVDYENCSCLFKNNLDQDNEIVIENDYLLNQVGYIKINDTKIDSQIMQYSDNDYYLTHDVNGKYSVFGSVYMDYRNKIDDKKILLFGHNTKNAKTSPFHDLEKYGKKAFYDKHSIIEIELEHKKYEYKIFSILVVSNQSNKHMKLNFKDDEWSNHLKWMIDESIYDTNVKVTEDDEIIVLQTCYYDSPNTFIIICAKKVS